MAGRKFSLIILRHDNGEALEALVLAALSLRGPDPEILIAGGKAGGRAEVLASRYGSITLLPAEQKRGESLKKALAQARGDVIGIIDADGTCQAPDLAAMLTPCLEGRADAVFGSRHPGAGPVPAFWSDWQRPFLTLIAAMLSNLNLSDPFCPCKVLSAEALSKIAPGALKQASELASAGPGPLSRDQKAGACGQELAGHGPGLEAEIAARAALAGLRILEFPLPCASSPGGEKTKEKPGGAKAEEGPGGEKLKSHAHEQEVKGPAHEQEAPTLGQGLRTLYAIIHHCAPFAPLPVQMLIYLFIGGAALLANLLSFILLLHLGFGAAASVILAFICSSGVNYLLCIAVLFRHKARWSGPEEVALFICMALCMGLMDYGVTLGLLATDLPPLFAKFCGAAVGFFVNFFLRRQVVFRIRPY